MAIVYKPMETEEEIRGKAYVHWRSWQETYTSLVNADYLQRQTLEKCTALAFRWPQNTLVAKDGDTVVGFSCYSFSPGDDLPGCGELNALYVLREYQRQGVGRALTDAALRELTAFPRVALWVLQGNEPAIRFYRRYGFRFDGGEQALSMGTALRMILEK